MNIGKSSPEIPWTRGQGFVALHWATEYNRPTINKNCEFGVSIAPLGIVSLMVTYDTARAANRTFFYLFHLTQGAGAFIFIFTFEKKKKKRT